MRFAGLHRLVVGVAAGIFVAGCAGKTKRPESVPAAAIVPPADSSGLAGVWDGLLQETLTEGMGAGDTRVEKQEWHLEQVGTTITGYYLAASTFTSGDGRPYVCSRKASFSALVRFDVTGHVRNGLIQIHEITQRASQGRCNPGLRPLAQYTVKMKGDVLTLLAEGQRQLLYRNRGNRETSDVLANAAAAAFGPAENPLAELAAPPALGRPSPSPEGTSGALPVDVSGVWIWEHRGAIPTGDEKQEREEWHVDQDGARLSGYYDRVVREISTDGHAFKCSMDTEFEIATRYKFRGEVRGNQLMIYESSYEVLEPSACDNGKRRLDAYEGMANGDEVRLIWGVGGQVLRRPRPDVPTQRF
ncbi:MAG: hypothetical protein H7X95_04160 [Deltaproteobacteria bacterium]|nr:hypothetical protein [Deltaproteobacteria bacterium]